MIYVRDPPEPFLGILYTRKAALCRHPVVYGVWISRAAPSIVLGRQYSRVPAITNVRENVCVRVYVYVCV